MTKKVVCRNEDCGDSAQRHQAPPPMKCVNETSSAWIFVCERCVREGRISPRVVTKDQIGGTFGAGRRDDGTGNTVNKGPDRYRPLGGILPRR